MNYHTDRQQSNVVSKVVLGFKALAVKSLLQSIFVNRWLAYFLILPVFKGYWTGQSIG